MLKPFFFFFIAKLHTGHWETRKGTDRSNNEQCCPKPCWLLDTGL